MLDFQGLFKELGPGAGLPWAAANVLARYIAALDKRLAALETAATNSAPLHLREDEQR
jgi:hypothetical protein